MVFENDGKMRDMICDLVLAKRIDTAREAKEEGGADGLD
jgi:hypothetical protein